jgi:hypothetical protein
MDFHAVHFREIQWAPVPDTTSHALASPVAVAIDRPLPETNPLSPTFDNPLRDCFPGSFTSLLTVQ